MTLTASPVATCPGVPSTSPGVPNRRIRKKS